MKVQVLINETTEKTFEVEVPDLVMDPLRFAIDVAKEKYKNGDFILDGDAYVTNKKIMARSYNEEVNWVDF